MKNVSIYFTFVFFFIGFIGLFSTCQSEKDQSSKRIPATLNASYLQAVLEELGSDKYMGRMPGTAAEPLTINYLKDQFQQLGLQPGNGESYFQEVPLVTITATSDKSIKVEGGNQSETLSFIPFPLKKWSFLNSDISL